jgi:hypothetical protein
VTLHQTNDLMAGILQSLYYCAGKELIPAGHVGEYHLHSMLYDMTCYICCVRFGKCRCSSKADVKRHVNVGGGTLLPKCGASLHQSDDGNSKVNGWGPYFANDRYLFL